MRTHLVLMFCTLICAALLGGCGEGDFSPFSRSVLEPIQFDDRETVYCAQDPSGNYNPDQILLKKGHVGGEADYDFAQGGGCVFRSIRETWAALHNLEQMMWGGVTKQAITARPERPEGVSHFYDIKYFVDNSWPKPDVDWTMEWYHSVSDGTFEEPRQIVINYKKVSGTRYIGYWEGSVVLDFVNATVTSIKMRDQINATQTGPDDSEGAVRDVIHKSRAGAPDWARLGEQGQ